MPTLYTVLIGLAFMGALFFLTLDPADYRVLFGGFVARPPSSPGRGD